MRRAAKIDDSQTAIVQALRKAGYQVAITSMAGNGFPDLVASCAGFNALLECKDGDKPPSARKLTSKQQDFHRDWPGPIAVVETPEQALAFMARRGA